MANKSSEGKVDHVEELVMIDAIQRLGLECYFGDDIDRILRKCSETDSEGGGDDLHGVALRFRLLRQGGYNLQADIFEKFIDNNGRFKQELEKDTKGLMSLFEASELGISGDQILDEASEFTWNLLNTSLEHVKKSDETAIIRNTLNNPFHKSLPRLTAKNQIHNFETLLNSLHDDCYGTNDQWIKDIQELAKIDVNMSQTTLKNEINQVSRYET
uniref:Terpene synthase N-terminal domain-containing protein n=1 Tax=Chenopodium quinoa TaxID=63459 RepID=A0A803LKY1_CHEQI